MTPLAQRILRELSLPVKRRTFDDRTGLLKRMDDVHCFECSAVRELAIDVASEAFDGRIDSSLAFLPAPKTWIEFVEDGVRCGVLLEERFKRDDGSVYTARVTWVIGGSKSIDGGFLVLDSPMETVVGGKEMACMLVGLLAMINTPRIIGRRQHMPHRGLERRLSQAMGLQGKFPLHAWTEILLHVTPPKDASDDPSIEAHLTGKKALHFCRAHLRVKMGRLEFVRAHWRGDGSLGIKQSRYRIAALEDR